MKPSSTACAWLSRDAGVRKAVSPKQSYLWTQLIPFKGLMGKYTAAFSVPWGQKRPNYSNATSRFVPEPSHTRSHRLEPTFESILPRKTENTTTKLPPPQSNHNAFHDTTDLCHSIRTQYLEKIYKTGYVAPYKIQCPAETLSTFYWIKEGCNRISSRPTKAMRQLSTFEGRWWNGQDSSALSLDA